MQYLNIIYFLIISFYGYRFLKSDGKILKGVLNQDIQYHYSGTELFWCLTFSTGLLAFSIDVGLDLMALRLLVLETFCIIGLSISNHKPVYSFPLKIYIIFLIWMVVGLIYSPYPMYGIRTTLKYLYPLLLCLFASSVVRDGEVFLKSSLFARTIGAISIILLIIPSLGFIVPGVFWYPTARAINYISIMIFSLGMFYLSNKKKQNLMYTALFLIPCCIWTFRTSIMGSMIAIMAFYFIKYKLKSLPIIAGVIILGIVAVFTIPSIKEKMFFDDTVTLEDFRNGKIDENSVNTNYRSYMWEVLQDKFYEDHKAIGSGTGVAQGYMYTHSDEFSGLKIIHSDFIQQKCDNGLIGLILFCSIALFMFIDAFNTYWRYKSRPLLRLAAIVAGASIAGVFVTHYSENTVNYSMATLSMPFGFYGMMLGLRRTEEEN